MTDTSILNTTDLNTETTATVADLSLPAAIVSLGLCAITSPATISKLTTKAAAVLGLENNRLKPIADKLAILEWLRDNVALGLNCSDILNGKTTRDNAPDTLSMFDLIESAPQDAELFVAEESAELKVMEMEFDSLYSQFEFLESQGAVVAARMGAILTNIKQVEPTGMFYKKVTEKYPRLGERRAQQFMMLADKNPELLDPNARSGLKLTQAILLSSSTEEVKTEVVERIENGETVSTREIARLNKAANDAIKAQKETAQKLELAQSDLIGTQQKLAESTLSLNTKTLTLEAVKKQNDELQNRDQALIDAKVGEEKAKLLLENSAAIQSKQKEVDDAQDALAALNEKKTFEINKLKSEQDKAIADGVRSEMNALDNDIRRKEYAINGLTKRIESLHQTKGTLNKEVGELQKHNKAIEKIKDLLGSLSGCMFDLIDDENATPTEVLNDWHSIDNALNQLKQDVSQIIDNGKSQPIDGALTIIDGDSTDCAV